MRVGNRQQIGRMAEKVFGFVVYLAPVRVDKCPCVILYHFLSARETTFGRA